MAAKATASAIDDSEVEPVRQRKSGIPPPGAALPPPLHRRGKAVLLADDREWIVPPFTFRQARQAPEILQQIFGAPNFAEVALSDPAITLTHMALARNYPELSKEDVVDLLDTANLWEVLEAIWTLGGLRELLKKMGLAP